jgi:hypothetical protein
MTIGDKEQLVNKTVDINSTVVDTKKPLRSISTHGFMPENRLDLLRALMMHEVLGQPKCKQSSLRKQS